VSLREANIRATRYRSKAKRLEQQARPLDGSVEGYATKWAAPYLVSAWSKH
jgi:hypothetical protein